MTVDILGRREDQHLELKSKGALDEPSNIARAVVGMLNAGGGEIWIGVEEADGVAVAIEPVQDPGREEGRLRDYLVDVVDPSPTADEVSIEPMPVGADPALLVVKVKPAGGPMGRKPYALRKGGGWHFLRRMGSRNHSMSRLEIFGEAVRRGDDPAVEDAIRGLEEARKRVQNEGKTGLWLGLQPAPTLHLDTQEDRFQQMVLDPSATANRRAGWHFARSSSQPKLTKEGIEWGIRSEVTGDEISRVEVRGSGAAYFWVALEELHWKGEPREIWPTKLLEYPISAFRIARVAYDGHLEPEDWVAADLALLGVGGWGLRKGTPGDFFLANQLARLEEADLTWEPVVFAFHEIDEAPDRCGYRLVRRVYQAFGLRETAMPRQYDPENGRLILPE